MSRAGGGADEPASGAAAEPVAGTASPAPGATAPSPASAGATAPSAPGATPAASGADTGDTGPPERSGGSIQYVPALDGVRALSVLAIMAYHGGVSWIGGGFFAVDTFFALSGFLITTLLVAEWRRRSTIRLAAFWAGRARRLLPALLLLVAVVALYVGLWSPAGAYPDFKLDALSTLFYFANWHFIYAGNSYFAQALPTSLLSHTWTLSIEEQFYLLWPLVVLGVLKFWRSVRVLLVVAVAGALASAIEMAVLYSPTANLNRLYYGTDTRVQALLAGAAASLALLVWNDRRVRQAQAAPGVVGTTVHSHETRRELIWRGREVAFPTPASAAGRWAMGGLGVAALGATAALWLTASITASITYEGGFLLAAALTGGIVVSAVCVPRSPVTALLSLRPLRYLGRISYGLYLWHFPLFIYLDGARTGLVGAPLLAVRFAATVVFATVSFYFVELPVRRGSLVRGLRSLALAPVALAATVAIVVAATTLPASSAAPAVPTIPKQTPPPSAATAGSTVPGASAAKPPVQVLLLGDSVALTLGLAFPHVDPPYPGTVADKGIVACGVALGGEVRWEGQAYPAYGACATPPPPGVEQWPTQWAQWVDEYKPSVAAILVGRWEIMDHTYHGHWTNLLHPAYAAYLVRVLNRAVRIASARGAHVAFLTPPCFDTGEQPDGEPWPEDSLQRLYAFDALLRKVAAQHPSTVSVINFGSWVCPHGKFVTTLDGVPLRTADGIHLADPGAVLLAKRLWPYFIEEGRDAMGLPPVPLAGAPTTSTTQPVVHRRG